MMPDTKDRVRREVEFYDSDLAGRRAFDSALTYLNDGIGRLRRNEVIRAAMQDASGMRVLEIGSQSVARRSGWGRSGNRDRNPVSRYWHDCRGVIVAQAELRFWMSRRGDQALAVIVAWAGGRPRPRLRSSAARRR